MRLILSRKERLNLLSQEIYSYYRFFYRIEKSLKDIVFYSAQAQYISFFEGLLDALIDRGVKLSYITSDCTDPILHNHSRNISPFYFNLLFPFVLPFLDAKIVVMTMPDLHLFHVRRSIYGTNHVYLFHSLMSTHMGFRPGALDHFDTILCAGPHHLEEIRRTEKLYNLKPKNLLKTGYYRLEKIYADHENYQKDSTTGNRKTCILIAPSGHRLNIVSTCARELVSKLVNAGFEVIFRPHPMTIYHRLDQLRALKNEFGAYENFQLDVETVSEKNLHRADVLISDWSGVAFEYAFGTERPVLFIDLPRREQNPEFHRIGIPPIEILLREKIGKSIRVDEIPMINQTIFDLLGQKEKYRRRIVSLRSQYVYNFGCSSDIGADQLMTLASIEP
jgi:YidC/Oxa1 family membrane protein insertase